MSFDPQRLQEPFTKLIKATKSPKKLKEPAHVHKLRTNTRRVEATLDALQLPHAKSLPRHLKKLRKSTGKVRDLDVLLAKTAGVTAKDERDCQLQLLAFLGKQRSRTQAALARELKRQGKEIRHQLQRCAKPLSALVDKSNHQEQISAESRAATHVLQLSRELQRFPALGRKNLHQFRIEGKKLRYVLQLSAVKDEGLLTTLRATQDAIGEWHDWEELIAIAQDVLGHGRNCELLREFRRHADRAYEEALRTATALRTHALKQNRKRPAVPLGVVAASANLAA